MYSVSDGKLRGVLQLINKESAQITADDVAEIGALTPALGEIFKTAVDTRVNRKISSSVNEALSEM